MKNKAKEIEVSIEKLAFPCTGVGFCGEREYRIKDTLPGQVVSARVKRRSPKNARLIEVTGRAEYEIPSPCPHFGICGGCRFLCMPYEKQLEIKEKAVLSLFRGSGVSTGEYAGITPSPRPFEYRNKMEFSFGDTGINGSLSLGMRRKNSYYEVVHVSSCMLINGALRAILDETLRFFEAAGTPYYSTRRADGILRHLVVRFSEYTGETLVNLVTTPDIEPALLEGFKNALLSLEGEKVKIAGILHTENASLADAVKLDNVRVLYGEWHVFECVLGYEFKIAPQSFFQTNTKGAEVLYKTALGFAGAAPTAFDLYCGTGTISLLLASCADKVYGVEIVPEAVESAREAAERNGVHNAEFICGDVLVIAEELALREPPDLIVIDPPREGVRQKALEKIASLGAEKIVYVSCSPVTLVRDLALFAQHGYAARKTALVDMFPWTPHVESVVLLSR